MSVARNLVILGVWATGMGALFWWKYLRIDDALDLPGMAAQSGSPDGGNLGSEIDRAGWKWQSESHWVVDQISRDLAEMMSFSAEPQANLEDPKVFEFSVAPASSQGQSYVLTAKGTKGPVSMTLPLKSHLWAVENYVPWQEALRRAWKVNNVNAPTKTGLETELASLTTTLAEPSIDTVVRLSQKLSEALTRHPQQAELHEAAALLIASFALREAAGHFSDTRPAMSRITAHLAMARSSQPEPGTHAKLAEAILLTLAVRQQEALSKVDALPAGLEPWQRALKIRNTGDWRLLDEVATPTLLEKREHARALAMSIDTNAMVRKYADQLNTPLPDWSRLGTERNFSVEEGHLLTNRWMEKELGELATAWKAWSGKEMQSDSLVTMLNDPATRCVVKGDNRRRQMEVLSWGTIAAGAQRHLCHAMSRSQLFLQDKWGVEDAAAGFERQMLQSFAGLRLLPFVQKRTVRQARVLNPAMEAAAELCRKHPELMSSCNWYALGQKSRSTQGAVKAVAYPKPHAWFAPEVPWGTAYDFDSRYHDLGTLYRANQARWNELLATAPYSYDVIRTHRHKVHGSPPTLDQMQKSFAPIMDYNLRAMEETAELHKDDPKAYLAAMSKVCQLDPDKFIKLGEYLVESQLPEDAAFAFQAAHELARDRVYWSNHSEWLVKYYYEKGRVVEALKIAEDAAQVYSYRGLATMAGLQTRLEHWDQALQHYQAIAERYRDTGPLLSFLSKNRERSGVLGTAFDEISKSVFPEGMIKVVFKDLSAAPEEGVQFTSTSGHLQRSGLRVGEVIVALDGYRVGDLQQYDFVRSCEEDAPLDLIVWDGKQYREVTATVPDRRFGCDIEDWVK